MVIMVFSNVDKIKKRRHCEEQSDAAIQIA